MTPTEITTTIRAAIVAGALGALTAIAACSDRGGDLGPNDLARIGTETLTCADLARSMPSGLSAADSTAFADAFVNNWITDRLIMQVAARHIRNTDEIDRRVEQYRRDLIIWEYRRMAVNADTALAISDADAHAYYDAHPELMKLDSPMVRGIYIKMESDAEALAEVRSLYASPDRNDIDRLEKVGLKGAIHYDYFRDQWIPARQIIDKIPREIKTTDLRKGYKLDADIDGFTYLLSVSDILPAGETIPFEAAEHHIRETLEAIRRTEADARIRRRLLDEALESGLLTLPAKH